MRAAQQIYNIALDLNRNDHVFPLFGIGLGFEVIVYLANTTQKIFTHCRPLQKLAPLKLLKPEHSKVFQTCPTPIAQGLITTHITPLNRNLCVLEEDFEKVSHWRVTSLSYHPTTKTIDAVASVEHKDFPFFGIKFHPEEALYEWNPKNDLINHTPDAMEAAKYFARFFVNECRRNGHKFTDHKEELRSLIINFPATFTAETTKYQQEYLFKANPTYSSSERVGFAGIWVLGLAVAFARIL